MISSRLKNLVKLSGGKIIIGGEKSGDNFVVMKMDSYFKELGRMGRMEPDEFFAKYDFPEQFEFDSEDEFGVESDDSGEDDNFRIDDECFCDDDELDFSQDDKRGFEPEEISFGEHENLTSGQLLDRINADISELRQRETEEGILGELERKRETGEVSYEDIPF